MTLLFSFVCSIFDFLRVAYLFFIWWILLATKINAHFTKITNGPQGLTILFTEFNLKGSDIIIKTNQTNTII